MSESEQLLQVIPQKIGKYYYYRLGETTINQMVHFGLIPKKDYGKLISKKPDGIIIHNNKVKGIVESKTPSNLNTLKKEEKAISQEIEVAKKLCKLLIITDNTSSTLWINALNGEEIKGKDGIPIKTIFDSKLTKNVDEIEHLIEEIDLSITKNNSILKDEKIIDPSDLAKKMWQTIWVATGKSPIKCLYNVVELLIFKFLSDLKVLEDEYRFNKVYTMSQNSPENSLKYYARNSRKQIRELFPVGEDGTTLINGTIFVNENGEANLSQAYLFHYSLKHLSEYENNFGSFIKIDKNFKTKLYETFLTQEVEALGQYFTPRKIVQSIIRMSKLDEMDFRYDNKRICDPFCGVGGFILEILNLNEQMKRCYIPTGDGQINVPFVLNGFDKGFEREDERTIILAKANMLIYLTDVIFRNPKLTNQYSKIFNDTFTLFRTNLGTFSNIFTDNENKYDYIFTNPPYVTRGAKIIREEILRKGLKEHYSINSTGLEGLSVQWIIRHLKPGGKSFVILPDGIMERVADGKLRKYIMKECYIDAIISLPVRVFYANSRKTYILAITKKEKVDDNQTNGIFTYIVSQIGEDLTKKGRYDIAQNDLPEMEQKYLMYNAIKNKTINYSLITNDRCKIISYDDFSKLKNWRIENLWSEEEQVNLGLKDEEIDLKLVMNSLDNIKIMISNLIKERSKINIDLGKIVKIPLSAIFNMERGNMDYTKRYISSHKGEYPVYSGKTDDNGIIGYMKSYDYDVKECLTWTADGVYAGTVFIREGKFSMTYHSGILIYKDQLDNEYSNYDINSVYTPYIYHKLNEILKTEALGQEKQNKRVTVLIMKDLHVEIPITENNELDKYKQEELCMRYNALESALDQAIDAKKELIQLLNKSI